MAEYDQIATAYLAYKSEGSFGGSVEYPTFVHCLLLPALGIKNVNEIDLKKILANYRVLDLACGGGYLTSKDRLPFFKFHYS